RERNTSLLRLNVPESVFYAGLGHLVPANAVHQRRKFRGCAEAFANYGRSNEVGNNVPGGIGGLGIVKWSFRSGDLAPAADSISDHFHQNDPAVLHDSEAGFKKRFQPHSNLAQDDGLDFHRTPAATRRGRSVRKPRVLLSLNSFHQ